MDGKTKILIVSDSPGLPTGLAETTRLIFATLLKEHRTEYEIQQIGLFHCYAVTELLWKVYPTTLAKDLVGNTMFHPEDKYGQLTFQNLISKIQPDIVFAFGDPQRVTHLCVRASERSYKLILYLNFDGLPVPTCFGPVLDNADLIVTKTEFSMEALRRSYPKIERHKLLNMYSPADILRFHPVDESGRARLRTDLFPPWIAPNSFVIGWIGRPQWRKQVWLLYKTLSYLRKAHYLVCMRCGRTSPLDFEENRTESGYSPLGRESRPGSHTDSCMHCLSNNLQKPERLEDVFLWFHMTDEPGQDWDLRCLEEMFDVQPGRDLYYTPGHEHKAALAPNDMAALYQLWDCLLYLSGGEGFGLPAWEAMCSGLPVVYTNYSGHAEFLNRAGAGLPIGGLLQPEPRTCVWRMIGDLSQAIDAVRSLYFDPGLRIRLGQNGRAFTERFAPSVVAARWHTIFEKVAGREAGDLNGGTDRTTSSI